MRKKEKKVSISFLVGLSRRGRMQRYSKCWEGGSEHSCINATVNKIARCGRSLEQWNKRKRRQLLDEMKLKKQ